MEAVLALLVMAGAGAGWGWHEVWRRRREPAPGHMMIAGVVVAAGPPLSAPLSGTPCVYWQLAFLEVGVGDWVERARIDAPGEFLVEHPGGVARVVADHARLSAPRHRVESAGCYARKPRDAHGALYERARAAKVRFAWDASTLHAVEYVIAPGESVRVQGYGAHEPDPTATAGVTGYREALPTRLVLSGTRRAPLLIATTS